MRAACCRGCGGVTPAPFLDLGRTPLANAFVHPERVQAPEPTFPLAVTHCPRCQLVQLTEVVAPEVLFREYVYFSSYSETFLAHARAMAAALAKRLRLRKGSRVLEIASNDGYLLQHFVARGMRVLGVEPATNVAAAAGARGIPTLGRFFDGAAATEIRATFGAADVVIGNNVLAHVPAVNEFLAAVATCLDGDGTAVFEFPYVRDLLDSVEFDTIYHEHVFYYSLSAVTALTGRAGLDVVDVAREPIHGGSLRVFLRHAGTAAAANAVAEMLAEERAAGLTDPTRYGAFSRDVIALQNELRALLRALRAAGKRIAAYGAPAKGTTLLNTCRIGRDLLDFTVDRSPHKQGLLIPGVRLPVRAPETLLAEMPDYTLILPWNLADEIVAQQEAYVARGGRFIVPIPKPRVL